jgi:hypothetical protein
MDDGAPGSQQRLDPAAFFPLLGPAGVAVMRDTRLALPDPGEARQRLDEVAAAVGRRALARLRCEIGVLPAGAAASLWSDAGAVPGLVVRHDDIPGEAHVRWLPASPIAVAAARAGTSAELLAHIGSAMSWPSSLAANLPAFEVRIVHSGATAASAPSSALAVTADPDEAAGAIARWHGGATEVLSAGPLEALPPVAAAGVQISFDSDDPRVQALVPLVDPLRLAAALPRGPRGTLESKTVVLLSPVDPGSREGARSAWIVARAAGRTAATIRVDSVISGNNWHRLDLAPWLWRTDSGAAPDAWRVPGAGDPRARQLALLAAGEVVQALELAGIELENGARRLLSGRRLGWSRSAEQDGWSAFVRTSLSRCAPWLLAGPALEYVRATCGRTGDGARVVLLPHQPWQSKAGLSLLPAKTPVLALRRTSSNRVLPRVLWERSEG